MARNARESRSQDGPRPTSRSRAIRKVDPDDIEWIIYARISDDRERTKLGVKRQETACRRLHQERNLGGTILCVLVDNDLTAYDKSKRYKGRPEYEKLFELLRERPGYRGILTWHTDRLHRTPRQLEDFIDLIEETRAPIETVTAGHLDLTTSTGRATARTTVAWARQAVEHNIDRLHGKIAELAEAGAIYGGGPRPFGYNRIYAGEGPRRKIVRDEINPEEAKIVRECANRVLSGTTLRTLVRDLNRRGVKTSTGKPWSQQGMRFMLSSGRIAGLREHHRQVVGKAVWDAIITEEEHEQLRVILQGNERAPGSKVRKHYLTGFVYCSDCVKLGVKMRPAPQHKKLKYKCLPDIGGCNGRVIGLADLETFIDAFMIRKLNSKNTLKELTAREADKANETAELLDLIDVDERRLEVLKVALDDGDEDELPEVVSSMRTLRRRVAGYRSELARLTSMPEIAKDSLPELAERWADLDLDERQRLLRLFVARIEIGPAVRGLARFDPGRVKIVPVGRRGGGS